MVEKGVSGTVLGQGKIEQNNNTAINKDSNSDSGEFQDTVGQKLTAIAKLIESGQQQLKDLELAKPGSINALKMAECKKSLTELQNKLQEVEKDPQSPLVDLSNTLSQKNYEQSAIGRLEKFAKVVLSKFEEPVKNTLKGPMEALQKNEFLNALQNFVKSVCNTMIVACQGL